ncbi:MAG: 5-formyltetrahydrofolate cyclo-ligase [Rhizobiales bacterium 62-47]|nr:5-formyltetrahydrofolate cyclo-ligase [Hyphomicrobiales bacterium]OJY11085.1 MAG: 5-formyltetrahydrofolate cyclo-ligase [Rhizobiales bacterium 62-47]
MTAGPMSIDKNTIRATAIAKRDTLSAAQREAAAQRLAMHDAAFDIKPGTVVAGYMPMRGEIDPRPLMHALAARGAHLALPVVVARDAPLLFRAWQANDALVAGPFGTSHPEDHIGNVVPDILLVPLAAFDRIGHRIGYGGGYYDRTLQKLRAATTIVAAGVAFAIQEVETVPASHHDAVLDLVLTDVESIDLRS